MKDVNIIMESNRTIKELSKLSESRILIEMKIREIKKQPISIATVMQGMFLENELLKINMELSNYED